MRSARNGAAAGECKCRRCNGEGKKERERERWVWVRERENAGAATPCKRKIYKLESPIKSVPAVTTSSLSSFHVERRLFVSFSLLLSRHGGHQAVPRSSAFSSHKSGLTTRKMERQAKSAIRKSESRVTMSRSVARDSFCGMRYQRIAHFARAYDSMETEFLHRKEKKSPVRMYFRARYYPQQIPRFMGFCIITQDFAIPYAHLILIESR